VPTLVLGDGRVIAVSTIIGEYLEAAVPNPPLSPRHPYERAPMRKLDDLRQSRKRAASPASSKVPADASNGATAASNGRFVTASSTRSRRKFTPAR
jgi:glutathione S-transferase